MVGALDVNGQSDVLVAIDVELHRGARTRKTGSAAMISSTGASIISVPGTCTSDRATMNPNRPPPWPAQMKRARENPGSFKIVLFRDVA